MAYYFRLSIIDYLPFCTCGPSSPFSLLCPTNMRRAGGIFLDPWLIANSSNRIIILSKGEERLLPLDKTTDCMRVMLSYSSPSQIFRVMELHVLSLILFPSSIFDGFYSSLGSFFFGLVIPACHVFRYISFPVNTILNLGCSSLFQCCND
jgi:hypothetical protein